MRFLILDTYARPILAHFAQNHPETRSLTYTAELKLLLGQLYGTADFYAKNLRLLGHPAQDIIVNYEALQKKWGRENNIRLQTRHTLLSKSFFSRECFPTQNQKKRKSIHRWTSSFTNGV